MSASQKRDLVGFLREEIGLSERRALKAIEIDRKTLHYKARVKNPPELVRKIKEIASRYTNFGYRRVHAKLKREGIEVNLKKLRRIYREERLVLRQRKKPGRNKFIGDRKPLRKLGKPNELWCMDFMFDRTRNGTMIMILTVIDQYSRYCPGIFVRKGFRQRDLIRAMEVAMQDFGRPLGILSDNGIEFTHEIFRHWAKERGISLYYIRPGRPTENGFIESFNGRVRDECLKTQEFRDLDDANKKLEEWRNFYNEDRPHSSLENQTPKEFVRKFNKYNL